MTSHHPPRSRSRISPSRLVAAASLLLASLALACAGSSTAPPAASATATGPGSDEAGGPRAPACGASGVAVQVLGSGGPIPESSRASSGYLLWVDGKARVLVDAGGGVFQRFGQAGAAIDDLDAILLSHLHADHSADLVALLKGGYFSERARALPLIGPSGSDDFPGTDAFLASLLSPPQGPYRYLSGYLKGDGGRFHVPVTSSDAGRRTPEVVLDAAGLQILAVGVEHGRVPALGYAVLTAGKKVAWGGDQSGDNAAFVQMATDADLLILHHPVPEQVAPSLERLHAKPSQLGQIAAQARAQAVVLSHHMQRALSRKQEAVEQIRRSYSGPLTFADDLDCFPVP